MKSLFNLFMGVIFLTSLVSCKKEKDPNPGPSNNSSSFTTTPEATADHDSKSGGIYKGVFVGSTGMFKLVLQGNNYIAELTVDGVHKTLTTSDLTSWSSGQAITGAVFSVDNWILNFSVDADGQNPQIVLTEPNHPNIQLVVRKELSTMLVQCFEGIANGPCNVCAGGKETGAMNFIVGGDQVVWGRAIGTSLNGSLSSTSFSGQADVYIFTGTISGDNASGSVTSTISPGTDSWSAKRTL
jgi:hypothetical protein